MEKDNDVRLANVGGRAALVIGEWLVDVETCSDRAFGPDLRSIYERWAEFAQFASTVKSASAPIPADRLGPPVPEPRQVFAIGINYASHAAEAEMQLPEVPVTFTKFPACLAGPCDAIEVAGDGIDWEVELVAVIGRRADRIRQTDAWDHVAGVTVGQDISDRALQFAAGNQFSLGKSRRGFGPMGPYLVTPDEFSDPNDLAIGCSLDGDVVQQARTSEMVFGVAELIERLSAVLPLLPGDVIFTGTPAGVGATRQPPRWLRPGSVLESWVEGIGTMRNRIVAATTDEQS
jgi:2-keto-4-pentenoate hydratase/2-oxohepta-3-ene-1,7-dioic acid hydratase in catechol pathway